MLSDLFFTINYWIVIGLATISLIICLLFIVIIITHRECYNCTNLLTCNTCVAVAGYSIFRIVESIYALRGDWQYYQPACVFRAYCILGLISVFYYSYSIQAISRLFVAVLYKHKSLLTLRTHCILIVMNWVIGAIIPIEPLLQNGFELRMESRNCAVSMKILSISLYMGAIVFIIPLNMVIIIYGVILYHVRQSTRRVVPAAPGMITGAPRHKLLGMNGRREIKIMRNTYIQANIIFFGGVLTLILEIWNAVGQKPPPESFYLLSFELISIFTTFMMITLFFMNSVVWKIALGYIFRILELISNIHEFVDP